MPRSLLPAALLLAAALPPALRGQDRLLSVLPKGAEVRGPEQPGAAPLPPFAWSAGIDQVAYAARLGDHALLAVGTRTFDVDGVLHLGYAPEGGAPLSICAENGRDVLREGWTEKARYDDIRPPRFGLKPPRMAFAASDAGRAFVVLDGRRGPESDAVSDPVFSPEGSHWAYWRRRGGLVELRKDGERAAAFPAPKETGLAGFGDPVFSPDGSRLAFALRSADGTARLYVDGAPGAAYADVGEPVFSPDGRHWLHSASSSSAEGFNVLLLDGRPLEAAQGVRSYWPYRFDGSSPVFITELEDGTEKLFDRSDGFGPFTSVSMPLAGPGGRRAFTARSLDRAFVVADGRPLKAWSAVGQLAFTDGGEPAYIAGSSGSAVLVLGERELERHEEIASFALSSGSAACWARDAGLWRVVRDGRALEPAALRPGLLMLAGPSAAAVRTFQDARGWELGIGDKVEGPFDMIGPTRWLEKEGKVAVGVQRGRELWRLEYRP